MDEDTFMQAWIDAHTPDRPEDYEDDWLAVPADAVADLIAIGDDLWEQHMGLARA
jgi:hypothetical protein